MFQQLKGSLAAATLTALLSSMAQAGNVAIPNAGFETLYKPGSTSITAAIGTGYTIGIGPGVQVVGGATYSDSTTGSNVDVPGWAGNNATGVQGFAAGGGQFPAGTPSPSNAVYVQGPAFGGTGPNLVTSGGLGALAAGTNYILSIEVGWRNDVSSVASPTVVELNANGNALTADASSSPALVQGSFVTYTREYDAASLAGVIGQTMTISFGVGAGVTGQQVEFDSVRLTAVPEPSAVALLGLSAVGLLFAVRRRAA
jgi:hypothetical protein